MTLIGTVITFFTRLTGGILTCSLCESISNYLQCNDWCMVVLLFQLAVLIDARSSISSDILDCFARLLVD